MSVPFFDFEAFEKQVWEVVRHIPYGRVTTYGQIAAMLPAPDDVADYAKLAPRWVGDAMNRISASDSGLLPWWRVINSKGGLSMAATSRAGRLQRERLAAEGVLFDAKERTDFARFGWVPAPAWLAEKGLRTPPPLFTPPDEESSQQASLF